VLEFGTYRYVGRTKDYDDYISGKLSDRYIMMRHIGVINDVICRIVAVYDIPPQGRSYNQSIANRLEYLWMNKLKANLNIEKYLDRYSMDEMTNLHNMYWINDGDHTAQHLIDFSDTRSPSHLIFRPRPDRGSRVPGPRAI